MKRSLSEIIYLSYCVLLSKLFYPTSRIIRRPFDIRGKKNIQFGKNLTTGRYCRIEAYSDNQNKVLFFGNNIQINDFVHIAAKKTVKIDDNVLIASKVFITDIEHGSYKGDDFDSNPNEVPEKRQLSSNPVHICKNVWIGELVSILPGVTI